jgi:hypothetical protein
MGDFLVILTASYVVGSQNVDVKEYVTDQQTKNYGAINFPVQVMDTYLHDKGLLLATTETQTASAHSAPELTITYTDASNRFYSKTYSLTDTVDIGQRSAWGKFVQKPGEIVNDASVAFSKGMMLFVAFTCWALVVTWSYLQWNFLQKSYNANLISLNPQDNDDLGILGKYMAVLVWCLMRVFVALGYYVPATEGWLAKFVFATIAVFAPVSSFFFQLAIWFTVVQSILSRK